ncbi:RES family NAD+ phosphorylase [Novosphingobium sp. SL115]|uniref:RES family NAD+ phosphorylase n=1 Tax=Novosphingobium sp. SL115 TaxID=2995150 RepID=UPI002273545D|nr:RES family NAD+ phosphorylase [Novosphingobium sp. SL115]MCY1669542.1 RES family NAD+ phosphorylase [Novosphingobium sp. SL115]
MAKAIKPRSGKSTSATPATSASAPVAIKTTAATSPPAPSQTIPVPPDNLDGLVRRQVWPTSEMIHRIHPERFGATQFNPGPDGNARFSPIQDNTGNSIATIYGGSTFNCVAMETVFHDVPHSPALKSVAKRKLKGHLHSQVSPTTDLVLAELTTIPLRKLGIKRGELIDSEKDVYPQTRVWAEAIRAQCADVHGLLWVSRQDDTAKAIVLFEDRLGPNPLSNVGASVDIVQDDHTYAALIDLADGIGVKITGS